MRLTGSGRGRTLLAAATLLGGASLLASAPLPLSVARAAPAATGPAHGKLIRVSSAFNFWAVACPPSGAYVAVGQGGRGGGLALPVEDGIVGHPEAVPGTLGLGGIACPVANECLATGQ